MLHYGKTTRTGRVLCAPRIRAERVLDASYRRCIRVFIDRQKPVDEVAATSRELGRVAECDRIRRQGKHYVTRHADDGDVAGPR